MIPWCRFAMGRGCPIKCNSTRPADRSRRSLITCFPRCAQAKPKVSTTPWCNGFASALPASVHVQHDHVTRKRMEVMTTIKAAAVQMSPVLYSREGTLDRVIRKIIELGSQGVQFATFPETVVPYYPYFCFVQPP